MGTERPFLTTGEIISLANVHPNTVAMWRATKKIVPRDKVGSTFLYDKEEVTQFLASRKSKKERSLYLKKKVFPFLSEGGETNNE